MAPRFLLTCFCLSALALPSRPLAGADVSVVSADEYGIYATVIQHYSGPDIIKDTLASFVVLQLTVDDNLDSVGLKYTVDSGGGMSAQQLRRQGINRKVDPIEDSTMTQIAGSAVMNELVCEFIRLNAAPDTLKGPFPGLRHVTLLSPAESKAMRDSAAREGTDYYMRFPHGNGEWEFSRVALNQAKDYALVYVGHQRAAEVGRGRLVLLRRASGRWKIVKVEMRWMS